MLAYVVANVRVENMERYAEYVAQLPATVEQYGGRFLARAGRAQRLEGAVEPARFVILEFPSYEQAKAWYDSEEYRPLLELRQRLDAVVREEKIEPAVADLTTELLLDEQLQVRLVVDDQNLNGHWCSYRAVR